MLKKQCLFIKGKAGTFGILAKMPGFFIIMPVSWGTVLAALVVAGLVGCLSALVPSYHASPVNIVEGLRIGSPSQLFY